MKKIFLLVIVLITLSSCENKYVKSGRKVYMEYLKDNLKDPSSLIIYKESYEINGARVKWTIDYGAKNSLGGMGRETLKGETINDLLFFDEGGFYKYE